tara:strand:- start:1011 stop:1838 length:828 start_codon:yes stop_codon:yes gene_type:complete
MLRDIFRLDKKVIVVTGGTGLLGKKHAEAIACFGGTPILLDLDKKKLNDIENEINKQYNVNCKGYLVDITNEDQIKSNLEDILNEYGKIDGLVNNAANNPKIESSEDVDFSRLENFSENTWHKDIDVGLKGSFLCSKYYGYEISKNPKGGCIVNISSDLGLIGPDQRLYSEEGLMPEEQPVKPVTYSVVKSGIIGLTRYLATYWTNSNVRCNALCPGGVENNQSKEFLNQVSTKVPMGRLAKVDEYQGTLIWVLSDASSYLNGAIIPIDGGRTAW